MKKLGMILFGVTIMAVLIYGALTSKETKQEVSVAKSEKVENIKIGMLQLLSHPALDTIRQGFIEEMEKQGYKEGVNLTLDFQNAQADQSNLVTMSQKLVSEKPTVLVGITTPATVALANQTKNIPIVMGGITYPVEAGLIKSETQPGNNITGVSDRTPIKQQLELMQQILPNMTSVGILYTASEDNATKQAKEAEELAKALGLSVQMKSITQTTDIEQVVESLMSQVDAIFVPIDNTVASAMPTVVKVTNQYKKPVFPSADTMVADGGLLGIGVDQYQIGVETAKVTLQILGGKEVANTPIVLANKGIIYLNESVAEKLGITIPQAIKDVAKKVENKER